VTVALITAGGTGERTRQKIPKQFIHFADKPLIIYTMEVFQKHPKIDAILSVCLEGWDNVLWAYAAQYHITKLKWIITGGETGFQSIHKGITELKKHCGNNDVVVIHDGNRGLVSEDIISGALSVFSRHGSALTVIPSAEAIFRSRDGVTAEEEIPRTQLYRVQSPQIYSMGKALWALDEYRRRKMDEPISLCCLMQALGEKPYFAPGSEKNMKITTQDDMEIFRALVTQRQVP